MSAGACALAWAWPLAAAHAESLADAISLAYQTNPALQAQRAQLRATDETYVQARAGYRPTISASGNAGWQWNWLGNPCTVFGCTPSYYTSQSQQASISLNQPLYTGGRATARVRGAEAQVLAARENLRQQEAQVMQQVIQVYMDELRDEQALVIRQDNVGVLQRQVDETRARFEVGEVTRTDVAQSEAQLAAARALLSSAQALLASDRAAYASVVGQSPTKLQAAPEFKIFPATIDQAFDTTQENNPAIRAADYTEQGAAANVSELRAERMPQVQLQTSYGYTATPEFVGQPNISERQAQASVVLTQPFFTGGQTSSEIRQAIEQDNVSRIQLEQARRTAIQTVSQAWSSLLAAKANIAADEEQVRAAQVAFEGTRAEQQAGLRTTLEVLTAQQVLENAQLDLIGARHDEYLASAAVLQVMGLLEARDLVAGIDQLPGGHSFEQLKHAFGYVPGVEEGVGALDSIGSHTIVRQPPPVDAPITTGPASTSAATPAPKSP